MFTGLSAHSCTQRRRLRKSPGRWTPLSDEDRHIAGLKRAASLRSNSIRRRDRPTPGYSWTAKLPEAIVK
jgi:hypothetical protein